MIFTKDKIYKDEIKRLKGEDVSRETETRSSITLDTETDKDQREAVKTTLSLETQVEEVDSDSEEGDGSVTHTETQEVYNLVRDRLRREIIPQARLGDYDLAPFALIAAIEVSHDEPRDYQEAMSSRDSGMEEWMKKWSPLKLIKPGGW